MPINTDLSFPMEKQKDIKIPFKNMKEKEEILTDIEMAKQGFTKLFDKIKDAGTPGIQMIDKTSKNIIQMGCEYISPEGTHSTDDISHSIYIEVMTPQGQKIRKYLNYLYGEFSISDNPGSYLIYHEGKNNDSGYYSIKKSTKVKDADVLTILSEFNKNFDEIQKWNKEKKEAVYNKKIKDWMTFVENAIQEEQSNAEKDLESSLNNVSN